MYVLITPASDGGDCHLALASLTTLGRGSGSKFGMAPGGLF
jgi:hypothetical protein